MSDQLPNPDEWIVHTYIREGPMRIYVWGDQVEVGEYQDDGTVKWRDTPLTEQEKREVLERSFLNVHPQT